MESTQGQLVEVKSAAQNSVELSNDAKGKVKIGVKVYDEDPMKAARSALDTFAYVKKELGTQYAGE